MNLSLNRAREEIISKGLRVGQITHEYQPDLLPNTVIEQNMTAGMRVSFPASINLLVREAEKKISNHLENVFILYDDSEILSVDLSIKKNFDQKVLIKDVCDRYSVPLKAAALQFGFGHPSVASTIPGARTLEEVTENFKMAQVLIPPELWIDLVDQKLLPKNIPFPV